LQRGRAWKGGLGKFAVVGFGIRVLMLGDEFDVGDAG
jgi:hypothetical protein